MIFTQQLGTLEGRTDAEAIKSIANHVRRMQEELEYRLSVLDSSNISELDAGKVLLGDGESILSRLEDEDGKYSEFVQTVEGFRSEVGSYEATVAGYKEQVSAFTQTAQGFQTTVKSYEATVDGYTEQVSSFTQTAQGFQQTVSNYETAVNGYASQVATFQHTAEGFRSEVQSYKTTVDGYTSAVGQYAAAADSFSAKISGVAGSDGRVTAASIAAKLQGEDALIQMIASKVNTDGFATTAQLGVQANRITAIVNGIGDEDGNVTMAGIALGLSEDKSFIKLIANEVDIDGIVTFTNIEEKNGQTKIDGALIQSKSEDTGSYTEIDGGQILSRGDYDWSFLTIYGSKLMFGKVSDNDGILVPNNGTICSEADGMLGISSGHLRLRTNGTGGDICLYSDAGVFIFPTVGFGENASEKPVWCFTGKSIMYRPKEGQEWKEAVAAPTY